jgi:putative transposase
VRHPSGGITRQLPMLALLLKLLATLRSHVQPSRTWRTFLDNHLRSPASIDFFTVPTGTFRVLFVFFALVHDRHRVVHFNVTEHPGAAWTAQQIIEALPGDTTPGYIVRDRDGIYGDYFCRRVEGMALEQVLTAPRSPWQNPYAERLVDSVRRECLDHVIVLGGRHLRRILKSCFAYYHESRTHLSLGKDAPEPRAVHPPSMGEIVELPEVGGLHHRYVRKAARLLLHASCSWEQEPRSARREIPALPSH